MQLRIEGPAAEQWAERLQQQFRDQFGIELALQRQQQERPLGGEDHRGDVLGAALAVGSLVISTLSLVAAVPATLLAWESLTERGQQARRIEPILTTARDAADQGQRVWLIIEGQPPLSLDQLSASELLDLPAIHADPAER